MRRRCFVDVGEVRIERAGEGGQARRQAILAGTVFAGTVFAVGRAGPRIEEGVQPDVLRPIGSQPRRLGGVGRQVRFDGGAATAVELAVHVGDRKSTRLNSSQ